MKDKLVRTGHKKLYYRFRALSFALLAFLGSSAAAAMPIAISVGVSQEYALSAATHDEKEAEPVEGEETETPEEALLLNA